VLRQSRKRRATIVGVDPIALKILQQNAFATVIQRVVRGVVARRLAAAMKIEAARAGDWPTQPNSNWQRNIHSTWVSSRDGAAPLQATIDTRYHQSTPASPRVYAPVGDEIQTSRQRHMRPCRAN